MMNSQERAACNLQQFSQHTQYLFDWNAPLHSQRTHHYPKGPQQKETFTQKADKLASATLEERAKREREERTNREREERQKQRERREQAKEERMDRLSRFQFPILGDAKGNYKEEWIAAVDHLVDAEFRKINQDICQSLLNQRHHRLSKQSLTTHHPSKMHQGLPSEPHQPKLPILRTARSLPKLSHPVMLIEEHSRVLARKGSGVKPFFKRQG